MAQKTGHEEASLAGIIQSQWEDGKEERWAKSWERLATKAYENEAIELWCFMGFYWLADIGVSISHKLFQMLRLLSNKQEQKDPIAVRKSSWLHIYVSGATDLKLLKSQGKMEI